MPLKYSLTENLLTKCLDDCSAQTLGHENCSREKFIKCLLVAETNVVLY